MPYDDEYHSPDLLDFGPIEWVTESYSEDDVQEMYEEMDQDEEED